MKRVCCAVLAALLLCLSGCGVQSEPEQLSLFAMDTYMTLAAYGDKASEALAACGQELNRLDGALSRTREGSEIYTLNAQGRADVSQETADLINETKKNGGRVICVGTTSCRTIESWAAEDGTMTASAGWTDIFIYPGYRFKVLDGLITNFHLPESTLIMLVSALAGREHVLAAYQEAVKERYHFFSFGDAMLIV